MYNLLLTKQELDILYSILDEKKDNIDCIKLKNNISSVRGDYKKPASEFIIAWANSMVEKYKYVYFKYEYTDERGFKKHILAVFPDEKVSCDEDYCKDECDFAEYFEYEYPEESLFISPDGRFCQCSTNALLIKHK